MRGITASALIALSALCGCSTSGYVAREQGAMIRELQVQPIFPVREDVQVGDVYYSPDPTGQIFAQTGKPIPIGMLVQTIDVHDLLTQYYRWRLSFPQTSTSSATDAAALANDPFHLVPQCSEPNRPIFQPGNDDHRLRLVGFPSFSFATTTSAELSATIPTEALTVAFGAAGISKKHVSFSAPVAEMCELPAPLVLEKWNQLKDNADPYITYYLAPQVLDKKTKKMVKQDVPLLIITGVYYARTIDVTITSDEGGGLGLQARLNSAMLPSATPSGSTKDSSKASGNAKDATAKDAASAKSPTTEESVASLIAAIAKELSKGNATTEPQSKSSTTQANSASNQTTAKKDDNTGKTEKATPAAVDTPPSVTDFLNNSLNSALSGTTAGGHVKFLYADDRSIVLRRTFDRPMAIGYRGVTVLIPQPGSQ